MLYHVPSGSKSSGSGLATGWVFWKRLRLATKVVWSLESTRITPLFVPASPCEHPAPASSPYSLPSTKATSATPLTKLPIPWVGLARRQVIYNGRDGPVGSHLGDPRGETTCIWTRAGNLLAQSHC